MSGRGTLFAAEAPAEYTPDPWPSLAGVREAAVDFETTGLRWWVGDRPCGVAVAWRDPESGTLRGAYLPTGHQGGGNLPEDRVRAWMRHELRGKYVYNLNTKFDAHMARAWGAPWEGVVSGLGDVGHRAALLDDHRQRFSLEAIAQDVLGEGKVQGVDVTRGAHVLPAGVVAPYARRDAELVLRILERQRPELRAHGLEDVVALEDRTIWPVLEMEANGARLDVEKLRGWARQSERDEALLGMRVAAAAGFAVNPKSPQDMERLYRARGVEFGRTADGHAERDDAFLAQLAAGDEVFALVRELSQFRGMREKFITPYASAVGDDGVLRFSLNQLPVDRGGGKAGTVSGRFSCTAPMRGEGANIQQVMKVKTHLKRFGDRYVTRGLFIPEPGKLLLAADARQIEYRIFAHYAKGDRLVQFYERDPLTDFHQVVTDMVQPFAPGLERDWVKNVNFMKLFGGGKKKTAAMLGTDMQAAEAFIDAYDRAFPESRDALRRAMDVAGERGYVKTTLGRRVRFPAACKCPACAWGPRVHKALNGVIQGTAADVNKLKLCELYDERRALGLTMRMTIHDEVVGDVPDAEAARRVGEILDRQSVAFRVPILWQVGTGANWREAK